MRRSLTSIASVFLFVLTTSVVAKASPIDLITNGTFAGTPNSTGFYGTGSPSNVSDPVNTGDYYHPTTITGWTFSDGSGIFTNTSFGATFYPPNPSSTPQFAFIQNAGQPNDISQTVTDVSGKLYDLSFLLSGSSLGPIDVTVSVGGVPIDTILAVDGWNGYTISFVGDGTDTISFSSPGTGVLAGLTDVSLVAETPEPSSMMLLGTGLLGVAAAGRRKFFNA